MNPATARHQVEKEKFATDFAISHETMSGGGHFLRGGRTGIEMNQNHRCLMPGLIGYPELPTSALPSTPINLHGPESHGQYDLELEDSLEPTKDGRPACWPRPQTQIHPGAILVPALRSSVHVRSRRSRKVRSTCLGGSCSLAPVQVDFSRIQPVLPKPGLGKKDGCGSLG